MSERDTHFANFAQLLAQELTDAHVFYETTGIGQLIIAQRAYDLVYVLLDKTPYHSGSFDVGYGTPSEIHETIERLPSLTEWPKMALEASAPDE